MRRRQSVWIRGCVALVIGAACVSEEPSNKPSGEVSNYIVDKAPEKLTPLNINFDDKVTLLGVELEPGLEVAPGKRVKLTMYWRADKPLDDPQWKLFTHVLDGSGDRLMNVDNVGALRQLNRDSQTWPPGRWTPDVPRMSSKHWPKQAPRARQPRDGSVPATSDRGGDRSRSPTPRRQRNAARQASRRTTRSSTKPSRGRWPILRCSATTARRLASITSRRRA